MDALRVKRKGRKQAVLQDSIHAAFPASFPPPPAAPKAEEKK